MILGYWYNVYNANKVNQVIQCNRECGTTIKHPLCSDAYGSTMRVKQRACAVTWKSFISPQGLLRKQGPPDPVYNSCVLWLNDRRPAAKRLALSPCRSCNDASCFSNPDRQPQGLTVWRTCQSHKYIVCGIESIYSCIIIAWNVYWH